jgi:hypothetical protein
MKHFVEIDNGGRLKTKLYDKRDDLVKIVSSDREEKTST